MFWLTDCCFTPNWKQSYFIFKKLCLYNGEFILNYTVISFAEKNYCSMIKRHKQLLVHCTYTECIVLVIVLPRINVEFVFLHLGVISYGKPALQSRISQFLQPFGILHIHINQTAHISTQESRSIDISTVSPWKVRVGQIKLFLQYILF